MFFVLLSSPFSGGRKPGERLNINHARPPKEQVHIFARPNKSPSSACSIWPFYQQKQDGIVVCVCWFSMILPNCLLFLVDEEKKRLVKSENDSFGKWSWLNGPSIHGAQQKSRRCFPKEATILSKRIDGAQQKNRRFFLKEATMLRGSSQYTLRYHLIALCKEPQ